MHRIIGEYNLKKTGYMLMNLRRILKKYAGQIGYYACVALVLAAVAMAAERFRSGAEPAEALVLPAVELTEIVPEEVEPQFELPADTRIIQNYAAQPEWNNVHRQWETHAAVDFVCKGGEALSFTEGIVRTVGESGVYGGFVEVETKAFLIRYCSVDPHEEIVPGKKLKKGESIGILDDSMPGENHMDAHLHLEVWEDGSSRNIMDLVGKNF